MVARGRVVAAFDVDGTLSRRDTLVPFLVRAFGPLRVAAAFAALAGTGVAYVLGCLSIDEFKRRVLRRLVAGVPAARLRALGPAHARAVASRLRPGAHERLDWHRAQGHLLVIVSSTLDLYLDPLGELLGIEHVLCSRLAEADGRFTGALAGADCTGPEKPRRLRALLAGLGVEARELHAYGDSDGDRDLLAAADHPHFRPFRG